MVMTNLATTSFLNHLRSLYPRNSLSSGRSGVHNPWYIVAAVAFSASNRPEAVPSVFTHVLQDLIQHKLPSNQAHDEKLLLGRKMRDALFKSGLTSGYPKAINSLVALHEAMPEELRDTKTLRTPIEELERRGEALSNTVYGEMANSVGGLLHQICPDMGWFTKTVGYGLTYGFTSVLSPLETEYTLVAAIIAGDTPRQIAWHLKGARRGGASLEEVKAIRSIAMEVASRAGVQWREGIPDIDDSE